MRPPIVDASQNRRTAMLAVIYAAIICGSFYLAYEVRFDFLVPESQQQERIVLMPVVLGVKLLGLVVARQLGSMMTYFSVPDFLRLCWVMGGASLLFLLPRFFSLPSFTAPRGVLLTDFMLCLGGLCAARLGIRLYRERLSGARRAAGTISQPQQRIAIIGAGDAGASLAKEFIGRPGRGFRPVMFFDDDPAKHGKLVHGVPVVGQPEMLTEMTDLGGLAKAVIAMPSASARRVREVITLFTGRGLKVETLPSLEELASGRVRASRIRPVEVQDLLGRDVVDLDAKGIRDAIANRCVMVTGAGGSIGSELCRQIAALNPKRLLLVEQAEGALFIIDEELKELGFGTIATSLVGDILDRERMEYIFGRYKPQIVFHAAAHKHVFMMERQPAEAIRNNVLGTRQIAKIAAAHGVDAFVLISTDKAINPTSVMGATKRLAEIQLMAIAAPQAGGELSVRSYQLLGASAGPAQLSSYPLSAGSYQLSGERSDAAPLSIPDSNNPEQITNNSSAARAGAPNNPRLITGNGRMSENGREAKQTKFMAVRFGNVLGSSGSVVPIFKRQIANGGPVKVTHPDVTRYFMTIPEAVGLVLQSFVLGRGGEIFVLDMGQPVKIVDLARQMIELSGYRVGDDIEIAFTGLKPGEKLFEELQHHSEEHAATEHPRIMRFVSSAMFSESGVQELEQSLYELDSNQLKALLKRLVPEYTPFMD